ncbi:helix-turn-helix transcriptional regulator [Streptomyces olivaceus]|uniref:helix-turn-helix transcriptional regulator n=1 Tax=Streptomyces olivaceus TaxID=47716 RepID=UPI0035DC4184
MITLKQIEQEHGIGRSSLHTYRRRPTFPQPVSVEGSTKIQYRADEVAAWFEANPPQQGKRSDLAPSPEPQGEPVTTTTDPRIAILSDLNDPPYNEVAEKRCVPWGEAEKMLDTYRAGVLHAFADEVEGMKVGPEDPAHDAHVRGYNSALEHVVAELRRRATEPEAQDG